MEGRVMHENIDVNKLLLNDARELLKLLWFEMLEEINRLGSSHFTPSLLISKIRDYNRRWNRKAEELLYLVPDAFKDFSKKQFMKELDLGEDLKNALKYL